LHQAFTITSSQATERIPPAPSLPLLLRLAAWLSRRRYGRVLAIIPRLYAWLPGLVLPHAGLLRLATCGLPIDARLRRMVEVHVSNTNGCSFCSDMHAALAIEEGAASAPLAALPAFRQSDLFTEREKAALAWAEEIACSRGSRAETFGALRAHFADREIVALSWLASFTTYLNTLAKSLGIGSQGLCEVVLGRRKR
jgi:AhpD family alkylhydroperoxidase/uncharacterized protein (TIGR03382 family)